MIPFAVTGARHTALTLQWTDSLGAPVNLTGATLTGRMKPLGGTGRAIDGTLTITSAATGTFTWALGANDVQAAGKYLVQFKASYADGKYDLTVPDTMEIYEAI